MDKTLGKFLSKLFELRKKPLTIPAKYISYVLPFLAKVTAKLSKIKTHFNVFRVNVSKRSMYDSNGDSVHTLNDLNCQPANMHIPVQ